MRNLIVLASLFVCLGQADTFLAADTVAYRLVAEAVATGNLDAGNYLQAVIATLPFLAGLTGLLVGFGWSCLDMVEAAAKKAAAKKAAAKAAEKKAAAKAAAKKAAQDWSPILGDADCF